MTRPQDHVQLHSLLQHIGALLTQRGDEGTPANDEILNAFVAGLFLEKDPVLQLENQTDVWVQNEVWNLDVASWREHADRVLHDGHHTLGADASPRVV